MCVSWKSKRKIKYAKNSLIGFDFSGLFIRTVTLSLGTDSYFKKYSPMSCVYAKNYACLGGCISWGIWK